MKKSEKTATGGILSHFLRSKIARFLAPLAAILMPTTSSAASMTAFAPLVGLADSPDDGLLLRTTPPAPVAAPATQILTAARLTELRDRAYRTRAHDDVVALQKAVFPEAEAETEWDGRLGTRTRSRVAATMARLARGDVITLSGRQIEDHTVTTTPRVAIEALVLQTLGTEEAPDRDDIRSLQAAVGMRQTGVASPRLGVEIREELARAEGTTAEVAAVEAVSELVQIAGPVRVGDLIGPRTGFGSDNHQGSDLRAALGTPVLANEELEVLSTGRSGSTGNMFVARHIEDGRAIGIRAMHFRSVSASRGEAEVGERLATIGSTGHSTGPHLHIELSDPQGRILDASTLELTTSINAAARVGSMVLQRGNPNAQFDAFGDMDRATRMAFNQVSPGETQLAVIDLLGGANTATSQFNLTAPSLALLAPVIPPFDQQAGDGTRPTIQWRSAGPIATAPTPQREAPPQGTARFLNAAIERRAMMGDMLERQTLQMN